MAIFPIVDQYLTKNMGPLDSKMLVKTFDDLTNKDTWMTDGKLTAYNGMLVAVWLNKKDTSKNGVYILNDPNITSTLKYEEKLDVTKAEHWHKLAEMSDLEAFIREIDLFKKIEDESELPNNFDSTEFNPNITYYRVRQLDPNNADAYILYTYIYDKDLNRYLRRANPNSIGRSISELDFSEEGSSIIVQYSDGTSKTINLVNSDINLDDYATKTYVEEYVEEYVEDSFTDFTESFKTTILYGGDADPNDDLE